VGAGFCTFQGVLDNLKGLPGNFGLFEPEFPIA
jgi:hypothetical protein